PQVRMKGWSSPYVFEWFLVRAFRAITGDDYSAYDLLTVSGTAWSRLASFHFSGDGEDTMKLDTTLVGLGFSPFDRAFLASRAIGFMMYYSDKNFRISITVANVNPLNPLLPPVIVPITVTKHIPVFPQ